MIVKILSTEVYGLDSIIETAAALRKICVLDLNEPHADHSVEIHFKSTKSEDTLEQCVDAFMQLVLKNSVRQRVRDRTRSIRDLIVRQAFIEGEFTEGDRELENDPAN